MLSSGVGAQGFGLHGWPPPSAAVTALLRPDADDSISDWTDQAAGTSNLYAAIDETVASDTDYIRSPAPPNTSLARFRLSDPTAGKTLVDPVIVRYRFKKTTSDDQKLDVTLKQGTTAIATWSHTGAGLTTSFQTVAQTLTAPQLASISDFNSLFVEFKADVAIDAYTVLLLHCDGTDGSTALIDATGRNTVTPVGNAQIDTTQSKFGGASLLLDGSGDYLSLADDADWSFGAGNWTVDLWMRFNVLPASGQMADFFSQSPTASDYFALELQNNSGVLQWAVGYGTGGITTLNELRTTTLSTGTWYHVAFVRDGSAIRIYQDGVQVGADISYAGSLADNAGNLWIGALEIGGPGRFANAWIDEYRVSKGIARWTSNFTPPTAPY